MTRPGPIATKLAALAEGLLDDALASDNLETRHDIFKAVSAYHIGITRARKSLPPEEDGTDSVPNMADFRRNIAAA